MVIIKFIEKTKNIVFFGGGSSSSSQHILNTLKKNITRQQLKYSSDAHSHDIILSADFFSSIEEFEQKILEGVDVIAEHESVLCASGLAYSTKFLDVDDDAVERRSPDRQTLFWASFWEKHKDTKKFPVEVISSKEMLAQYYVKKSLPILSEHELRYILGDYSIRWTKI